MFTPVETSIGAVLLFQGASNLLFQNGHILGISGLLRQLLSAPTPETLAFFGGMAASYLPLRALAPHLIAVYPDVRLTLPTILTTVALGTLVGWGTKASNGCTSGHMLCGVSRLSGRSTIAVATFFSVAVATNHLTQPTPSISPLTPAYQPTYPSTHQTLSLLLLATLSILATHLIPPLLAPPHSTTSTTTITTISSITPKTSTKSPNTTTAALPPPTKPSLLPARTAACLLCGHIFALGLQISHMSSAPKVLSFFRLPYWSSWDPSLALIPLFAMLPFGLQIWSRGFARPPAFAEAFKIPEKTARDVNARFFMGAAAFGVAWGWEGVCPGPAVLRALVQPVWGVLWIGGFWAGGRLGDVL